MISTVLFLHINLNQKMEVIMKTLRFALIAAMMTLTLMSMAQHNERNTTGQSLRNMKVIDLCIAAQNPGLRMAIRAQVNIGDLLTGGHSRLYFAPVNYRGNNIMVRGSYFEWIEFFKYIVEKAPAIAVPAGNTNLE
jgi:hypothetical protein